ncbi:hypothetical protein Bca4012_100578 [Brassica carinata]
MMDVLKCDVWLFFSGFCSCSVFVKIKQSLCKFPIQHNSATENIILALLFPIQ